jgi:nucleotide-binding universal stress UspA family protein
MVIGAHDHTALGRLLMGSNTGYLVHNYEGSLYVHQEPQG